MPVTGKLGTSDSQFGNILLAGYGGNITDQSASNSVTFSQSLSYNRVYDLSVGNTLAVTDAAPDYPRVLVDTIVFVGIALRVIEEAPSQSITFVNIATAETIRTFSQSLTFSQTLVGGKVYSRSVSNSITLSQAVIDAASKKSVSQTITFAQVMDADLVYDRSFSDTISLVQVVNMLQLRIASNAITFTDSATSETYTGTYGTMAFSQTLGINVDYVLNANFSILALAQTVTVAANRSVSASNTITLSQSVSSVRARFFDVGSVFFPHNTVIPIRILVIAQSVSFDHDVVVNNVFNRSVSNTITFNQTMNRAVTYNRAFADVFPVINGQNRPVNIQGRPGYTYVPSTSDPSQVSTYQYVAIPGAQITKVDTFVSFTTPGYVLYLKQPDFGDSEGNLHKVVEHRTITGKLYTHVRRQPGRGLKYRFEISRAKAEETRWFLLNYLSTPMYLTNWKGEIWYGYITNNPFKITSKQRSMPCNVEDYEIDVEFEGVRIH